MTRLLPLGLALASLLACSSSSGGKGSGGNGDTAVQSDTAVSPDGQPAADEANGSDGAQPTGYLALVINEFEASNSKGIKDEAGEQDDWVEIANPTDKSVSLGSLYLSDSKKNPARWKFPADAVVEAHGYVIVWCDKQPEQGKMHTTFKLSATNGDTIQITAPDGETAIDAAEFGPQEPDVSMARVPDLTGALAKCSTPTPEKKNKCD